MVQDAGGLSRALSAALGRQLLPPLIDIVAGYARVADCTRAVVQLLDFGEEERTPSTLLLDSARRRLLWTDSAGGELVSMTIDDLKAHYSSPRACARDNKQTDADIDVDTGADAPPVEMLTVAGQTGDDDEVTGPARCLGRPSSVTIEQTTHWPPGTDAVAAAAAAASPAVKKALAAQVGAGALWVTDPYYNTTGSACALVGCLGAGAGCSDGPSRLASLYDPSCIVWDTANERALVADIHGFHVRAISRSPPPSPSAAADAKANTSN
jgi:hypothetical protein